MAFGMVILNGPDFVKSAEEIAQKTGTGLISNLNVLGVTEYDAAALQKAFIRLRPFFTPQTSICLFSPQPLPTAILSSLSTSSGIDIINKTSSSLSGMSMFLMQARDLQNAIIQNAIMNQAQFNTDVRKTALDRWKVLQQTQTKIFEIQKTLADLTMKTSGALGKFDGYIR